MYQIAIANHQDILEFDEGFLEEVARQTFAAEGVHSAELSLALLDTQAIRRLNWQYLGRDEETDVLSFLLDCRQVAPPDETAGRGAGKRLEGEVLLSVEKAGEVAEKFHWRPADEVVLYIVHGILHLIGYDDLSEDERVLMRRRERDILQSWNLSPHYGHLPGSSTAEDGRAHRTRSENGPSGGIDS